MTPVAHYKWSHVLKRWRKWLVCELFHRAHWCLNNPGHQDYRPVDLVCDICKRSFKKPHV